MFNFSYIKILGFSLDKQERTQGFHLFLNLNDVRYNWFNTYLSFVLEQGPPVLGTVSATATTIDSTWILESRPENGCPLGRIFVDGGEYFNFSLAVTDTDERQPVPIHLNSLRPNSLYLMRVSIENNAGISNPAIVGVQTLDLSPGV